ncbi:hypothetical protein [Burkholderia sp. lig30]|jgi:hypothetical protein|uniref:hypothetical protein n=1 Tax=Burkholderia sp. lig30 TaxID=1192124 RepID=UPI0009FA6434|nr:hypothetical protein [Burkholderia sp. lig30]
MVALARSLLAITFKIALFVGLFVISMRFIHTYPLPMPLDQQHQLLMASRKLGIRDPDDLYLSVVAIVNLVAAAIEYTLLMRVWRNVKMKWRRCAVKCR